jgi:hypothetical protein
MERVRHPTPATGVPAIDAQVGELFVRAHAVLAALRHVDGDDAPLAAFLVSAR